MSDRQKMEFHQDPESKAKFPSAYFVELLFGQEGELRPAAELCKLVEERIGPCEYMFDGKGLYMFYLKDKSVVTSDQKKLPVGVTVTGYMPFDPCTVSDFERSQLWGVEDVEGLLSRCKCKVVLGDWMSAALPYNERVELLQAWIDLGMELFPDCMAVRVPDSGRLLPAEEFRNNPYEGLTRFLHGGINMRFFNIAGREEYLVDSLGLFALGLPDVQCHFHSLDPNEVVNHLFDVASYLFDQGDVIQDGETVPGLGGDQWWTCQHEMSMVQPTRVVLDINPGRYAAGRRQEEPEG